SSDLLQREDDGRRRDDPPGRRGLRRRGRQAGAGGHAHLGAQGPPRAPGPGRQRRPVHEVPPVGGAVLRRARRRRAARLPAAVLARPRRRGPGEGARRGPLAGGGGGRGLTSRPGRPGRASPAPAVGSVQAVPALHANGPEPALEAATAADPAVAVEVLAALAGAVRAITLGSSLDRVLHRLAASARDLVGARYAAIGLPEQEGDQFARFVTVGMSDELIARLGPLPRTHGLLDAMLRDPSPYRTDDITRDPRFRGWWPEAHPQMRSFLGVPIVSAGDIVGAFYLTEKLGAPGFTAADEAAVVLLASHAAIAIDQARLFEDSRELALAQERGRLARELHDALAQTLFSLRLAAETAASLQADDPAGAAAQVEVVRRLAGQAADELRTIMDGLR